MTEEDSYTIKARKVIAAYHDGKHVDRAMAKVNAEYLEHLLSEALREADAKAFSRALELRIKSVTPWDMFDGIKIIDSPPFEVSEEIESLARHSFIFFNNGMWDTEEGTTTIHVTQETFWGSMRHNYLVGFEAGFRKAMSMNAIARLPTEEEIHDYAQWGPNEGSVITITKACHWMHERILGEKK